MTSFPMESVSPDDTKTELGCGIAKTSLMYFQTILGKETVCSMVAESRMNYEYLLDDKNWISFGYYCRLLDALVQREGTSESAYESGQYGARSHCIGLVKLLFLGALTPKAAYQYLVKASAHWNRVADWTILKMGADRCSLEMTLRPWFAINENFCLAIQGYLSAMPQLWNLPPARVIEVQCQCRDARSCRYELYWLNPLSLRWKTVGAMAGAAVGTGLFVAGILPLSALFLLSALGFCTGLSAHYRAMNKVLMAQNREHAASLEKTVQDVEILNKELQDKVMLRTAELAKTAKDLQESQDKVVASARHVAIGVLAAGMAHELNNPLNSVSLSLQGLQEDIPDGDDRGPLLAAADRATQRCRRIVAELLAYSRDPNCHAADLAAIVTSTVSTFRAEQSASLAIELDIAPGLPLVSVDRGQIQQVVMNLLNNAAEAMAGKGRIGVSVRGEGGHVVVTVRDTGPGMSEETRRQVFDPFFTTKPNGKGLGLGLAITWQMVQRNGGMIDVESRLGEGSAFMVRLPLQSKQVEKAGVGDGRG